MIMLLNIINNRLKSIKKKIFALPAQAKSLLNFNYPKPKRVIYENFCYFVNSPTYLIRKYLAQQLIQEPSNHYLGKIPREQGFLVINDRNFVPLKEAREFAEQKLKQTNIQELLEKATGKHQYLLALPIKQELTLDSPLIRLGLNRDLVTVVTEYMGILPILNSVNILYSPNQSIFDHSSQYFHLDPEGVKQVKIFIYLDEVTIDGGPFTLIPGQESEKVYAVYKGGRLTDEFVSQFVAEKEFTPITGTSGTMILVDTSSCFHYGSRPGKKDRPAILLQYVSPFAMIFPSFGWQRQTRLSHLAQEDTPMLERYLLGAAKF